MDDPLKIQELAKALERFKFTEPVALEDISTVHVFLRKTFPGVPFEVFLPVAKSVAVRFYVSTFDYHQVTVPVI